MEDISILGLLLGIILLPIMIMFAGVRSADRIHICEVYTTTHVEYFKCKDDFAKYMVDLHEKKEK